MRSGGTCFLSTVTRTFSEVVIRPVSEVVFSDPYPTLVIPTQALYSATNGTLRREMCFHLETIILNCHSDRSISFRQEWNAQRRNLLLPAATTSRHHRTPTTTVEERPFRSLP
jgi:hypothetical protein